MKDFEDKVVIVTGAAGRIQVGLAVK